MCLLIDLVMYYLCSFNVYFICLSVCLRQPKGITWSIAKCYYMSQTKPRFTYKTVTPDLILI